MTSAALSTPQSEALLGTAVHAETFILIETPQPWLKPALLSPGVPESLRQWLKSLLGPDSGVRVHLIANEQTQTQTQRRILIFRQATSPRHWPSRQNLSSTLVGGYRAWQLHAETPEDMAATLSHFWQTPVWHQQSAERPMEPTQRHLMICTHASHNECCGIYGYPFYREAIAQIKRLNLTESTQVWQISHIGGHRFAPTLIDFPQGRYYGNLNQSALLSLLNQRGAIAPLLSTYRGWSLLPKPLQILEAELLSQYGWDWLQGRAAGRILTQSADHSKFEVELWFESSKHPLRCYTAVIDNRMLQDYKLAPLLAQGA